MRPRLEDCIECRNCGQPIFDSYGKWIHFDTEGHIVMEVGSISIQSDYGMSGCRSASFRPGHGWDDSLNRKWVAKPVKR